MLHIVLIFEIKGLQHTADVNRYRECKKVSSAGMRKHERADAHIEWALPLALRARVGLDLGLARVLEEGPQHIPAPRAVEFDALQLREHVCAPRHHARCAHQFVQVRLSAHTRDTTLSCNLASSVTRHFRPSHLPRHLWHKMCTPSKLASPVESVSPRCGT